MSSPNECPLSRPCDYLSQQDLDDCFSRFSSGLWNSTPPATLFDGLLDMIRLRYITKICFQNHDLQVAFDRERHTLETRLATAEKECYSLTTKLATAEKECYSLTTKLATADSMLQQAQAKQLAFEKECHTLVTRLAAADATVQQSQALVKQSNEMAKQAADRLAAHQLRQPIPQMEPMKGSRTRAVCWVNAINQPGAVNGCKLPTDPATVQKMERAIASASLFTNQYVFEHEREMYPPVCEVLTQGLNHSDSRACVYDTSSIPYLDGFLPDLSITLPGTIEADAYSLCVAVDMKLRDKNKTKLGTYTDFGQLFDYLLAMQIAQPGRRTFVGLLSDIKRNYIVTIAAPGCGPPLIRYDAENIATVLAYLHDTALKEVSHLPPGSGFSPALNNPRRRLGNPRHSSVGEFFVPHTTDGTLMAVKRTTKKTRETYFLKLFAAAGDRPPCIPLLVYNNDEIEFGITPVGIPLTSGIHLPPVQMRQILTDVIRATAWLHSHRVIHRDIRCENVVVADGGAVLIDFDASYFLGWSLPTRYYGGYLCIPPTHLKEFMVHGMDHLYTPSASDDCFAIVLLAYCLIFPNRFTDLWIHNIGTPGTFESTVMAEFWDELEGGALWGRYMRLASKGVANHLKVITEIFC